MADIDALSLKELKALIAEAGLSAADCIDKADLRERAAQAQAALAAKPSAKPSVEAGAKTSVEAGAKTSTVTKTFAGYECILKGPADLLAGSGAPADLVVVALHGLGATNGDLAPVPEMLGSMETKIAEARTLCVFPQAPQSPIGSAWWEFNVMGFMQAMQGNTELMATLLREKPKGLDAARASLGALLAEARALGGGAGGAPLSSSKMVLMGFSLGAITSLDLALDAPVDEPVAGVVFMNGAPICVEEWATRIQARSGTLRVHMTAGAQDMTLPEAVSGWARDLLKTNGVTPAYHVHQGGHDLGGPDTLRGIGRFVRECLERATA